MQQQRLQELFQGAQTKIKVFETRTIEVFSRTNDYVKADAIVVSSPVAKAVPIVEGANLDENKGVVGTQVLAASATYTRPTSSSKILLTGSSLNVRMTMYRFMETLQGQ